MLVQVRHRSKVKLSFFTLFSAQKAYVFLPYFYSVFTQQYARCRVPTLSPDPALTWTPAFQKVCSASGLSRYSPMKKVAKVPAMASHTNTPQQPRRLRVEPSMLSSSGPGQSSGLV